mmetsp:Transcript_9883/g.28445  ORF Transcript_9883/g.28445 Transcript_9883/m.28445 type:complete len:243 (+) Transcript_9883:1814-2542(+)
MGDAACSPLLPLGRARALRRRAGWPPPQSDRQETCPCRASPRSTPHEAADRRFPGRARAAQPAHSQMAPSATHSARRDSHSSTAPQPKAPSSLSLPCGSRHPPPSPSRGRPCPPRPSKEKRSWPHHRRHRRPPAAPGPRRPHPRRAHSRSHSCRTSYCGSQARSCRPSSRGRSPEARASAARRLPGPSRTGRCESRTPQRPAPRATTSMPCRSSCCCPEDRTHTRCGSTESTQRSPLRRNCC